MIGWLKLTDAQRKATIDEAEQNSGISAKALEKDWWVTLTLKALFQSAFAKYMVFKGGTSLSKGWNLIARFSEDIDIALAPEAFDMKYIENPAKSYVERLRKKGCEFTSHELRTELEKQMANLGLPVGMLEIIAAPVAQEFPDKDPQTIYVKYPTLYDPSAYIADEVKIEVSVRSLRMPFTKITIKSLLTEFNENSTYAETPFDVNAVEPKKTFLEKAFLLHEEFGKPDKGKIRTERMSRHLYDLITMAQTNVEQQALSDHKLYNNLIKHREQYSRISWVDYKTLGHETIVFIPPAEVLETYQKDYEAMQAEMIYRETFEFDELIKKLQELQDRFRTKLLTDEEKQEMSKLKVTPEK
ncbi:MAG: nucleotidyl transferase AbiEii/AbiGii toxin family protein [Chitinophagaceae bacterium]|nr:nucleotidyl transferase AbiEii/AbiGii toxin family protein [Chitinophagaceae bacterium]